jgi:hypothetical protein
MYGSVRHTVRVIDKKTYAFLKIQRQRIQLLLILISIFVFFVQICIFSSFKIDESFPSVFSVYSKQSVATLYILIRALSAHSAAEFNSSPGRWQQVWLVAIVPP